MEHRNFLTLLTGEFKEPALKRMSQISEFIYVRDLRTKDGVSYQLRPARISDSDQIIANISAICAEKIYLNTDNFVLTDHWRNALENSVDEENGVLLLVAKVDKRIVGHLRLFPVWYGAKTRHVGELGLAVTQPWRARGIGKAMLDYALRWSIVAGFQKIIVTVFATNQHALNLFRSYNFVQEGCLSKQLLVEGNYVDEVLLRRFLCSKG